VRKKGAAKEEKRRGWRYGMARFAVDMGNQQLTIPYAVMPGTGRVMF
jgi:hypothetical protein